MGKKIDEYRQMGDDYLKKRQFAKAVEYYNKVSGVECENFSFWYNKGHANYKIGKFKEAINCFNMASVLEPKDIHILVVLSSCYEQIGENDAALACLDKAIIISAGNSSLYIAKAKLLLDIGKIEEAMSNYDKAIELDPNKEFPWNPWEIKAHALIQIGQVNEALKCYDRVIELFQDDYEYIIDKGNFLFKQKEYDKAIECYDKVIRIAPDTASPWNNKGNALQKFEKYEEAITCYNESIKLDPASDEPWYNKGKVLQSLGKYHEALMCYEKAMELISDSLAYRNDYYIQLGLQYKDKNFFKNNAFLALLFELDKYWKSFKVSEEDDIKEYLYQYCPKGTLKFLIDNREFRLTPVKYLNDPLEGKILHEFLMKRIAKLNKKKPNSADYENLKDLLQLDLYQEDNKNYENKIVFVRSLTRLEDSLIMWNSSYGDYAKGVAVGIPISQLLRKCGSGLQLMKSKNQVKSGNPDFMSDYQEVQCNFSPNMPLSMLGLYKIKYINPEGIDKGLQSIFDILVAFLTDYNHIETTIERIDLKECLQKLFQPLSHVIKHKHFEHENEYRLIYIADEDQGESMQFVQSTLSEGIYIQTEDVLFALGKNEETRVYLGPKLESLEKSKIRDSIRQKKIKADIRDSTVFFR